MRQCISLNAKWSFSKTADGVPAAMPEDWERVDLPHTWNAWDGVGEYYRGRCFYAKEIDRRDLPPAERYYLEVRGANASADVYMNGAHLAHHDGGYSAFRADVTEQLADINLLVIAVDNGVSETVYPQMADFTFYGGLYRDVNMLCVNQAHFDLDYWGGPGVKVTPTVTGRDA